MMKLCCLSLSFKRTFAAGQMDLQSFLDTCRSLGLDGVDLHERAFASQDRDFLAGVKRSCLQRGLDLACLSISNNFARPRDELADDVARTKVWIDAAAFLGVPQVRVFAGRPSAGEDVDAAWDRCAAALRDTAAYGAERAVLVALQNHNHHQLLKTGADLLRMVQGVAHANLGHVLDTGQYAGSPGATGARDAGAAGFDYLESIRQTASLATHVRCKLYRLENGRETWLDYDRIFASLREVGYNGWISLVYEGEAEDRVAVSQGVPLLRSYIQRYST